jgi:hypothetical protein
VLNIRETPVQKNFKLPSQALSCAGYTGIISASLKKHPGNSSGDIKEQFQMQK